MMTYLIISAGQRSVRPLISVLVSIDLQVTQFSEPLIRIRNRERVSEERKLFSWPEEKWAGEIEIHKECQRKMIDDTSFQQNNNFDGPISVRKKIVRIIWIDH